MAKAVLDVRLLEPADWQVLRDTRLRALIDSPGAFTAYYHRECRLTEGQWRQRLHTATWVVAIEHGAVIGIAGLVNDDPEEPEHVESIWVAPGHRNRGVFGSLLNTMVEIGRRADLTELWLWVLEDNQLAQMVYAQLGFRWTGERKPIDPAHRRFERRLSLAL